METNLRTTPVLAAVALLFAACSVQRTAQQSDDVYYMPSDAPVVRAAEPQEPLAPAAETATDDYYDANAAQQNSDPGGYYNMAYNDPYYYNYGRFGFGSGLGSQNGWMMNGWGQQAQWGFGTGIYSGWYGGGGLSLGFGWGNYGWGGWNHPWGYNSPWGWNDPWYNGWGYGGYGYGGNGFGYGNYYGPYGGCSCCYTPIIVGGSINTVVAHRPSFGNNAPAVGGTYQRRMSFHDPIGLTNTERAVSGRPSSRDQVRTPARSGVNVPSSSGVRGGQPTLQRPTERQPSQRPGTDRSRSIERQAPAHRGGGSDRSGGSASPSRSGGGSNGGGGTRSPGTDRRR